MLKYCELNLLKKVFVDLVRHKGPISAIISLLIIRHSNISNRQLQTWKFNMSGALLSTYNHAAETLYI